MGHLGGMPQFSVMDLSGVRASSGAKVFWCLGVLTQGLSMPRGECPRSFIASGGKLKIFLLCFDNIA